MASYLLSVVMTTLPVVTKPFSHTNAQAKTMIATPRNTVFLTPAFIYSLHSIMTYQLQDFATNHHDGHPLGNLQVIGGGRSPDFGAPSLCIKLSKLTP